jgi:hypothetical protein
MEDFDFDLDDVVIFELPSFEDVEAFRERMRPRWDGWSDAVEQVSLFTARLEREADVAELLRAAQELVGMLGLESVPFYLDGRAYALEAPRPARTADLAARSK